MHAAAVTLDQVDAYAGDARCTLMSSGSAAPVSETAAKEQMQSCVLVSAEMQTAYEVQQIVWH